MSPTETTAPSGCEKDTATANRLARAGADHLVCQRSDPHRPPLRALRQLQIILHGQGTRRRKALTGQSSFPSGRGACQRRTSSLPTGPIRRPLRGSLCCSRPDKQQQHDVRPSLLVVPVAAQSGSVTRCWFRVETQGASARIVAPQSLSAFAGASESGRVAGIRRGRLAAHSRAALSARGACQAR
jgi:hypothetical protein